MTLLCFKLIRWSRENNIKLHEQQFELIIHTAYQKLLIHELFCSRSVVLYSISDNIEISPVNAFRDIGITANDNGYWSQRIHQLVISH